MNYKEGLDSIAALQNDAWVLALNLLEHRFQPVGAAGFIRWKGVAGIPIVPDESGTNDRMNPVFRRFRKLYINQRNPRNLRDTSSALSA